MWIRRLTVDAMKQYISYTIDYRDSLKWKDDVEQRDERVGDPTIIFRGATTRLLYSIFSFLVPSDGKGVALDWTFNAEHDVKYRNGCGFRRYAITLLGYNSHFCSMEDLFLLIECLAHKYCDCEIKHLSLSVFLNT